MQRATNTFIALVVVAAELGAIGLATTAASAQESGSRQVLRQQRLILQQQRQIEANQRRLQAQEQRIGRSAAAGPREVDRGILGNIGNCPVGWTYGLFTGCLPAVHVVN